MNAVAVAEDGNGGFKLNEAAGVSTFYIDDSPYAIVTGYGQDSCQVIDLRDPSSPVAAGNATDEELGFTMLDHARGVATFTTSGSTFAIVCGRDEGARHANIMRHTLHYRRTLDHPPPSSTDAACHFLHSTYY